jgi:glycosyltransferase involved in cell wall biosynthesis
MRLAVVAPRAAAPCSQGSTVRAWNLYRHLSLRHEVRQLSQAGLTGGWRGLSRETEIAPRYHERYCRHPLALLASAVSERAWPSSPVASGLGLRLARPRALGELMAWADVTLVEFPWQFAHCKRTRPGAIVVYSSHNVETVKFASFATAQGVRTRGSLWLKAIARMEAAAVSHADLVVCVSAAELDGFVRRYGADPARLVEVRNGADTQRYAPVPAATKAARKEQLGLPSRPTVVFVGSTAPPNRVAARMIRRLAASTDRFTFLVVGPVAPAERAGSFVATGLVDDVGPYLEAADLAVCPIAHGAGTKIKLWESLAAGLPTVAFPESVTGTGLVDGRHLVVAADGEPSVLAALDRLGTDTAYASALASAARAYVVERHDWRLSARRLESALLELVERHRHSQRSAHDLPAGQRAL